ncbi:gluconolactonase, partial [Cupriavidus sp. SIMBA_020]
MLAVSMHDCTVLAIENGNDNGATRVYANLSKYVPGPCNDMLVDPAGRAYVGNFGFNLYADEPERATDLLCVLPDGSVRV